MSHYRISIAAAFLAGMLAGALAMGGRESAQVSDDGAPRQGPRHDSHGSASLATATGPDGAALAEPVRSAVTSDTQPEIAVLSGDEAGPGSRFSELAVGWARMQEEITKLQGRVEGLERRLAGYAPDAEPERPERPRTPEDRRSVLVKSGVLLELAADIVSRESQYELERLELRDLAIREGWFGSDRYREEVVRLDDERPALRAEIGDDAYDRYLFASGEDNRVRVGAVIPGSPAEAAGLVPGDLIESYGGGRVFTFSGLRDATSEGERGELVPVSLQRADGSRVQVWLPRGPMGVRLDMTRTDPDL